MDDYDSDIDDSSSEMDDYGSDFIDPTDPYHYEAHQCSEVESLTDSEEEGLDFKTQLRNCLDDVQHQGTFSSFQNISAYINPGLQVKEVGNIGLPLSARDAKAIAEICKQSPFGKGDETLVDETVRKTWELDTNEFICRNPAWYPYLDTLVKQAVQDLGVQVPVSAQPYKLLLYEQGAFFKAHRDTEKVPGMFGTLVVCLPCEHTGGDVLLVHGRKQRSITTASESAFGLSALAWYSDVQHEIKSVTSGYRLVLTYNLVQDTTCPKQTAVALDASHARFDKLLRTWQTSPELRLHDIFIYPLEHRYTQASLSLQHLKGEDAAKGRYLDHLCAKNGFYWFLAQMTKTVDEDEEEDEGEEYIQLSGTTTPSGEVVSLNLQKVTHDEIVVDQHDLYGDRSADSEDEGQYTGNESMPSTYRYHNTVTLLVRKHHAIEEFCRVEVHSPSSLLGFFELIRDDTSCDVNQRHDVMQHILVKSLSRIDTLANASYESLSFAYYPRTAEAKRVEYVHVFETVSTYCYAHGLETCVGNVLQNVLGNKNWAKSKDMVGWIARQVATESSDGKSDVLNKWFSTTPPSETCYEYVHAQQKLLEEVEKMLPHASVPSFNKWKSSRLQDLLKVVHHYFMEDVEPLWELIAIIPLETYQQIVLPTLADNTHQPDVSRLLHVLGTKSEGDVNIRNDVVRPTYKRILATSTSSLELSAHELTEATFDYLPGRRDLKLSKAAIEILSIIDQCMKLGFQEEADMILRTCLPDSPALGPKGPLHWRSILMFIPSLVVVIQTHNNNKLKQAASEYITKALKTSSSFLATLRPEPPTDWSQPNAKRGGCTCAPCADLKSFLLDPSQPVGRFSYAERVRKHLEHGFDNYHDFRFETVKGKTPFTLVVHKTRNEYTRSLQQWKKEVMDMRDGLAAMPSEILSDLLGGDVLEVAGLDDALVAAGNAEGLGIKPRALQPASASSQNQAPHAPPRGQKRKADIVDLTEDEVVTKRWH